MRRVIFPLIACAALLAPLTSCRYDDSELRSGLSDHEARLTALETITAALQKNDHLTSVTEIEKDGQVVGYTLNFSQSGAVTICHGDSFFKEIRKNADNVILILSDGTTYEIPMVPSASGSLTLASVQDKTATFSGTATPDGSPDYEVGIFYTNDTEVYPQHADKACTHEFGTDGSFTVTAEGLVLQQTYSYIPYTYSRGIYTYGEQGSFTSASMTLSVEHSACVARSATFTGMTNARADDLEHIELGLLYSTSDNPSEADGVKVKVEEIAEDGSFTLTAVNLMTLTKYHYRSYICHGGVCTLGTEIKSFTTPDLYAAMVRTLEMSSASDLSLNGTTAAASNCYIVSQSGLYKFKTVKGNSDVSVGTVSTPAILWETFGTSTAPNMGDLISGVYYKDDYIAFEVPSEFKEGNAVIAAKGDNGTPDDVTDDVILWSWHIWLTDEPQGQEYYNNAGTMMDRNLGATSATPGDIGALGLLYQWGRKDPFLGSSSISSDIVAASTIIWPSYVESSATAGTVAYVTANPTTFILGDSAEDWHYSARDNTLWQSEKTIYDPCPAGWRVPDGGPDGVWVKASNRSDMFSLTYNSDFNGADFDTWLGDNDAAIWYPAAGFRALSGDLYAKGAGGYYWACTTSDNFACAFWLDTYGNSYPQGRILRMAGNSVRCLYE